MENKTHLETQSRLGSIGGDKAVNVKIENGEWSLVSESVYFTWSFVGINGRWRSLLSSDTYKKNLIAIAVMMKHTVLAIGECYFCC